jgi:hypothetical protein
METRTLSSSQHGLYGRLQETQIGLKLGLQQHALDPQAKTEKKTCMKGILYIAIIKSGSSRFNKQHPDSP